jgi:oligoendopeptidase F
MKRTLAAIAIVATTFVHAASVERPEDRWNLADLYRDVAAWKADVATLEGEIRRFGDCRGKLGASARQLRECLDLRSEMTKRYLRVSVYANELLAEDTAQASSLELRQKVNVLGTQLREATSFVRPEILATGNKKVEAFLAEDAGLRIHRHPLDDILRTAPHTLDARGEAIIANFSLTAGASRSAYSILANSDMPWPTVKLADGTEARIDQSAYTRYREAASRDDRKKVFDAFWGKWKEFERTMGVTFYESLKEATVQAKVRNYPDSMARAFDGNRIPVSVYEALIASTNANLPTLHRYFRLRAKMLGVDEMRYYDVYPPLVSGGRRYPIEEGVRLMLASAKPLGKEYVDAMAAGVKARWMDVYPRRGKLSGAHMAGAAYDVHPYLLLNYNDNYESVSTLAHEWGHAMHSHLSSRAQPFATAGYATFVAEIASTFNEALLLDHVLKSAATDDERLLYLGSALETLRGTYFRQAMFAEFEREVHARVDRGESLTGQSFTKIYGEILRRYHGEAAGVVRIDDLYTMEWAYIPHFYTAYYVYQYATSLAASSLMAESVIAGKPGARERYLELLKAGGSDYPYELVKRAGVDLATAAPYDAVARQMNRIMDEIEAILARRK